MLPLPTFIHLYGPLGVSSFALTGILGWLAGLMITRRRLRGGPPALRDAVELVLTPLVVGVVAGGRLANQVVTQDLVWYSVRTWVLVTGQSLSFVGGLVGAVTAIWWSTRRLSGIGLPSVLDALAPGASVAVAIGWVGVPVMGKVTSLPWALPVAPGTGVQPVQLYGLLGFAALAWLLHTQAKHLDYPGQNFVTFVVLGAALRFVIAFGEQSPALLGPWSAAQLGDALTALAGLVLIGRLARPGRSAPMAREEGPTP